MNRGFRKEAPLFVLVFMKRYLLPAAFLLIMSCHQKDSPLPALVLVDVYGGDVSLNGNGTSTSTNIPVNALFVANFSLPLDTATANRGVRLLLNGTAVPATISFLNNNKSVSLHPTLNLQNNQKYLLKVNATVKGKNGESFAGATCYLTTALSSLSLESFKIDGINVTTKVQVTGIALQPSFELNFSTPLDPQTTANSFIIAGENPGAVQVTLSNQNKTVTVSTGNALGYLDKYTLSVASSLKADNGDTFSGYSKVFYTQVDATPKFPTLTDDDLLTQVQQQTLKYFYDFGHPDCGMARERDTSGDIVTTGGSGFGIMGMVVGIERGFISRANGITRFNQIVTFLETADRFHGAWSHWMNGTTGHVVPFAPNDNGADIVETSYMIQGLLTVRQYLTASDTAGNNLINRITALYDDVEWDWFRRGGQNVLYWNWSPQFDWAVNVPVRGYNETLITYLMAAGSSTHSIPVEVYQQGWAQSGTIVNGKSFYGHQLLLGEDYGGPLFFTQYSFLGFNPNVSDSYMNVDYWTQNVNQSLINHDYCVGNPQKYVGYSDQAWGLTASDNPWGYGAQSPTNDNGTISPTAAISSIPYTPSESINAIKYFYYTLGDRLWGPYGFYDAYNVTEGWVATSTLAIDQGPIIVMIENYRTQLLWTLFMSAPEVQAAKTKLEFN